MKPGLFPFCLMSLLAGCFMFAEQPANKTENSLAGAVSSRPTAAKANSEAPSLPNYKYEAKRRRDPFRSLDIKNVAQASATPSIRPPGLKGQLVSEIKVVGIVKSKGAVMAIAEGHRGRTFFLHPQDDLYDGKVLEIKSDAVIFSQILTDSYGKKVSQQLVKKLHPTRGEGNETR